jgi:hypothetical protein
MPLDPKWTATIDTAITNKAWDDYDATIKAEVTEYNTRFAGTPEFVALDWKMFKALLWVESGGPSNAAWKGRVMQIGNPGDKGWPVIRDGKESAPLIMSEQLKKDVKGDINKPELNIRAAMAYALVRLCKSEMRSVDDPKDATIYEHTVEKGESLASIATKKGSTLEVMKKLNPSANLQIGQKVKYRKASIQRVILGWMPLTSANLASRYNGGGDSNYAAKLDYVLGVFPKLKR